MVAGPHAVGSESSGQPVRPFVELSEGEASAAVPDRLGVRRPPRLLADELVHEPARHLDVGGVPGRDGLHVSGIGQG